MTNGRTSTVAADRSTLAVGGIILAIILFLGVNVLATSTVRTRIDLTEQKLFTLSSGTVEVLQAIDEPVTLRYYVSRRLTQGNPLYARYAERVDELLATYSKIAGDRLAVETYHPEPYSREEDRAVASGLQGVPWDAEGELVYFGVVGTNSTDDTDKIAFLSPERENFLEYDLTRLIYNLANPKKKVVGVVSSLPVAGSPQNRYRPWLVYEQMEQFFKVRMVDVSAGKIDDDVDLLFLAQIDKVDENLLYAIDQFLLRGGQAVIFADPHLETPTGRPPMMAGMPPMSDPGFDRFFEAWGVTFSKDAVLGDRTYAHRVNFPLGDRTVVVDYLPWLGVRGDALSTTDVVTGSLQTLNLQSAGYFSLPEGSALKLEPLVQSSAEAMPIETSKVMFRPNPLALLESFKATGQRYTLAGRLSGTLKTAFPDGPPKPGEPKLEADATDDAKKKAEADLAAATAEHERLKAAHLAESKAPVNLILVGDADMLADDAWVRVQDMLGQRLAVPFANNGDFALNALDNLLGSSAVIGLRSRGLSDRPFELVDEIRSAADLRYRSEERKLEEHLKDIERKMKEIRTDEASGSVILTSEQRAALDGFRNEMLTTRGDLREVQRALRQDIESLDSLLKIVNIALIPVLIAILALIIATVRRARFRRRHAIQ